MSELRFVVREREPGPNESFWMAGKTWVATARTGDGTSTRVVALGYGESADEAEQNMRTSLASKAVGKEAVSVADLALEQLALALAEELERVAPPKIEGGSPARAQWLADLLAVQSVLMAAGHSEAFVSRFMDSGSDR